MLNGMIIAEVDGEGKFIRQVGKPIKFLGTYSVLDYVIEAYSDGNYDYFDEDTLTYACYRSNGERFYLMEMENK